MYPKKIIYDFGANNGDDLPYYLRKSDLVVAVEANPVLTNQIHSRFENEIDAGKLIVENCVLTAGNHGESLPFYIHKTSHVLSQFPKPDLSILDRYDETILPSKGVMDIINTYGAPHYIKIDIEHYDQFILREIFDHGIRPPYISAESHSIEIFALLVALGKYNSFKLVDGASVHIKYKDWRINSLSGTEIYSFPGHSAGPFGEDIKGAWMSGDNFSRLLTFAGLGWKDIHASCIDQPDHACIPSPQYQLNMSIDF